MWRLSALAALFFAHVGFDAAHAATCNAQIAQVGQTAAVAYDPFDGGARAANLDIEFVNGGDEPCTLSIAAAEQMPGGRRLLRGGHAELHYLVTSNGAELANDIGVPGGAIVLPGGAGKRQVVSLKLEIPPGQVVPSGTYASTLNVRAYDVGNGGRSALGDERSVRALAVVQPRAQVNLAGGAGSFGSGFGLSRIDFGAPQSGAERNAFVQVRATGGVTIQVSSKNKGWLRHTTLSESVRGIPYALRLDGTDVPLDAGVFSMERSPPVSIAGASYQLNVRLGEVKLPAAGDYQDIVTIDVSPH